MTTRTTIRRLGLLGASFALASAPARGQAAADTIRAQRVAGGGEAAGPARRGPSPAGSGGGVGTWPPRGAADPIRAPRVARRLEQPLPAMRGDSLTVTVLEVTYAPGGTSAPHVHPCPVFGYVVAGALRMQFKGHAERVYRAGESFYEAANGGHLVGRNASATEPARLVATFVCDQIGPLSRPLGGPPGPR